MVDVVGSINAPSQTVQLHAKKECSPRKNVREERMFAKKECSPKKERMFAKKECSRRKNIRQESGVGSLF
jgi:rRNA processing protein Gar1